MLTQALDVLGSLRSGVVVTNQCDFLHNPCNPQAGLRKTNGWTRAMCVYLILSRLHVEESRQVPSSIQNSLVIFGIQMENGFWARLTILHFLC
jgi:hypothetical protein